MMIDHFLYERVDFRHKKLVSSFLTVQKIKYSHRIQNLFYILQFQKCFTLLKCSWHATQETKVGGTAPQYPLLMSKCKWTNK